MAQHNPQSIQRQIDRMFESGQSLFAETKVQDWLKQRGEDPNDYDITFRKQPAPVGSRSVISIAIELNRKDGRSVEEWLLVQLKELS